MTIYPTFLYIKQHSITGLKYFGKTVKDPYKYKGSGKHWARHIKKHGTEHIETLWVSEPYTDSNVISDFALAFSKDHNIVESKDWANQISENGLDGGGNKGISPSAESKQKMSAAKLGKTTWNKGIPRSDETKQKISDAKKGKPTGKKGIPSGRKGIPTGPHSAETKHKMRKPRGPYGKQQNPSGPQESNKTLMDLAVLMESNKTSNVHIVV